MPSSISGMDPHFITCHQLSCVVWTRAATYSHTCKPVISDNLRMVENLHKVRCQPLCDPSLNCFLSTWAIIQFHISQIKMVDTRHRTIFSILQKLLTIGGTNVKRGIFAVCPHLNIHQWHCVRCSSFTAEISFNRDALQAIWCVVLPLFRNKSSKPLCR